MEEPQTIIDEMKSMLRQFSPMISIKDDDGKYQTKCMFCREENHTEDCLWTRRVIE